MSRTGARDKARRQLTETLTLLSEAVALAGKSRSLIEHIGTPDAAQYLADLDAFCSRPIPVQVDQHPDNQAVDTFAAAMKTKLAEARAKGRHGWCESWVQDKQLAELMVGHIPKGNAGNFEDIANFAMMLHQRGADPMELSLAFNKAKLGQTSSGCRARNRAGATTIKERPILFSGPMVQGILKGNKTVTRRTIMPVRGHGEMNVLRPDLAAADHSVWWHGASDTDGVIQDCPYGKPGDRLWVRETWLPDPDADDPAWDTHTDTYVSWSGCGSRIDGVPIALRNPDNCIYREGWDGSDLNWRPSIHMPRWACRILLEITDVRAERLHDISRDQAIAEGVMSCRDHFDPDGIGYSEHELFSILWVSLNGHEHWNSNPWVWVIDFRQVKQ